MRAAGFIPAVLCLQQSKDGRDKPGRSLGSRRARYFTILDTSFRTVSMSASVSLPFANV
jgi:hypothetical protein